MLSFAIASFRFLLVMASIARTRSLAKNSKRRDSVLISKRLVEEAILLGDTEIDNAFAHAVRASRRLV